MKTGMFIFLILLIAFEADAQVSEEWVARSIQAGGAYSMVLDSEGNAYVTGTSQTDIFTIKYNPVGEPVWTARYNGPANGNDYARAITVDQTGNVYVTGLSYRTFVGYQLLYDYATIKYDSEGVQQWVQRYKGPANGNNYAMAIATDPDGNVYVTGSSTGENGETDYATVKYNSAGAEQWVQRYSGPGNNTDYANSIAVDEIGNVYVTGGRSYGTGGNRELATIKYNTQGEQQWLTVYNEGGFYTGEAVSVKLDQMGNIYITGNSWDNYATIKYNPAGEQQWVHVDNTGIHKNYVSAMVVDSLGNIYLTGSIRNGSETGNDYYTNKINSNGIKEWTAIYNGPASREDVAKSIAVDEFGSVYVTGFSWGIETFDDYATIKYSSDGVQQWVQRYNGPANDGDIANSIAVDGSGNVFVTGESQGDYLTIKYSQEKEKEPPINLTYDLGTHSLKWTRSPSGGVINQLVLKQEYDRI
ncbi:MAG: SBBP repeat-containing protein [Rhodothermaceae bacterium]|nr:SBBP repeat-containing protein [Rhodothermaceae bacterium]